MSEQINFEAVRVLWDGDRPFITRRGEKGKFGRYYLNDAEQQAYKEFSAHQASEQRNHDPRAVSPAAGRQQSANTIASRAERGSKNSSQHVVNGVGDLKGPSSLLDQIGSVSVVSAIPVPLNMTDDTDWPGVPGERLARRSVTLIDSVSDLANKLYLFGAVDASVLADLRVLIDSDIAPKEQGMKASSDDLATPFEVLTDLAIYLTNSYRTDRSYAPMRVVHLHAAPAIAYAFYVVSHIWSTSNNLQEASNLDLLTIGSDTFIGLHDQVNAILEVYRKVQSDISFGSEYLLSRVPEEVGTNVMLSDNLSQRDLVMAVDDLVGYLIERITTLTQWLAEEI